MNIAKRRPSRNRSFSFRVVHMAATLLAGCALLTLVACDRIGHRTGNGGGGSTPHVTTITVTLASSNIAVGGTETSTAVAEDQNGAVMSGVVFAWASSNTGVATISDGVANGLAVGTTGITASSAGVTSNSATLTVTDPTPHVASIAVSLGSSSIAVGETEVSTAQATDQFGAAMTGVTFTWASSNPAVATVADSVATGVAVGTTDITASSGGVTSNAATLAVTQAVGQTFKLLPATVKLIVAGQFSLLAQGSPVAPTWVSSDPSVATVDANGQVTAIAKGSAVITATAGAAVASSNVKVFKTTGTNADPTSDKLIAQALAAGTISSEQALEYRVLALFGDPRLPDQFDGAPGAGPDHMLMRDVRAQLPTLTQTAQDILNPFFAPPIYTESAFAQQAQVSAQAGRVRQKDIVVHCKVTANPTVYRRVAVSTPDNKFTFNVFYFFTPGGADPADQARRDKLRALAELTAALALEDYTALTGLLNRFPVSDAGLPCDGGDGGIDFYLFPTFNLDLAGQTVPYSGQCANTPSFVLLNQFHPVFGSALSPGNADSRAAIKSIVAHELLHVLQLAMTRQASCADTKWFDEATAEWAMDFVEPKFPPTALAAPGLEDGLTKLFWEKQRSGIFYATYLYTGHLRSLEKGLERNFGYADYLFFQYLARSQSPQAIKEIYDSMATGNNSIQSIAATVDMHAVWPEFAKTLWNDVTDHVLDYWQKTDDYDFGLADVFANPDAVTGEGLSDLRPLEIDQKGKTDETFTLLDVALKRSGSGNYEIPPRSMIYEQLKFTDPTVHTAIFTNPIAGDPGNTYIKVWVVKKVGGEWKAPEDWTEEPSKAFCLDKKDDRLEQLLVIVSNSETDPSSDAPYRISLRTPMQVATTNVGCWHWTGTASLTTHLVDGPVTVESATADYHQAPSVFLPDAGLSLGYLIFGSGSGTASFNISGFNTALGCTITGSANAAIIPRQNGPVVDFDSTIIVNFGLPDPLLHRAVIGTGRTTITGVRETYACPGSTEVITFDREVQWLSLPEPPDLVAPTVSDDGQSFTGRWARTDADGDKVSVWDLHATREQ
jgi:uncharacterized protein YjdB